MPRLVMRRGKEHRVLAGHMWVYQSEVEKISTTAQDGQPVDILNSHHRFLARGLLNRKSIIAARIYTYQKEDLDHALLGSRLERSADLRRANGLDLNLVRLVSSEGDMLPGLVVDKYEDVIVVQFLTLAMDARREAVARLLVDRYNPVALFERSNVPSRKAEGLAPVQGLLFGKMPAPLEVEEDGVRFRVDVERGQKTGLFLDQRANRELVRKLGSGKRCLDVCCYTGGFGLHAMKGGAAEATGVDISAEAIAMARINAEINGLGPAYRTVEANAFDYLRQAERRGESYDLICLDPPSFARGKSSLPAASSGYKELNLRALKLLTDGGILVTCCCSYPVAAGLFLKIVTEAAGDAGRLLVLIHEGTQSLDHPVIPAHPETRYLKCLVFRVWPR